MSLAKLLHIELVVTKEINVCYLILFRFFFKRGHIIGHSHVSLKINVFRNKCKTDLLVFKESSMTLKQHMNWNRYSPDIREPLDSLKHFENFMGFFIICTNIKVVIEYVFFFCSYVLNTCKICRCTFILYDNMNHYEIW